MERFDIFLSHNSRDKPAVEEIARQLKASNLNPWLDKWQLVPGERWQSALERGLQECPACGVFIGPSGIGDWAREELDAAQNRAAKEPGYRLIPILLPGCQSRSVSTRSRRFSARAPGWTSEKASAHPARWTS